MMNHQLSKQQNRNAQIKTWKQNLLIDKRQIQSHQKDFPKLFSFSNTIPQFSQVVNKMIKEYDNKDMALEKQQKKIFSKLNDLNTSVADLKQTLKYYEYTNQYLVKVQNLSESVYGKIQKIKQSMANQFQALLQSEQSIQNDLKLYDHKVEMIISGDYQVNFNKKQQQNQAILSNKQNKRVLSAKKSTQNIKPPLPNSKNNEPNKNDKENQLALELQKITKQLRFTQQEVQQIQYKINSLGKNLGWNQQDHGDFVKIWNRCQGKNYFEIQDQLIQYFRLYTQEQVREHMNKYIKFRQFNQDKKQKIIQYKHVKQQKKIKQFQIISLQQQKQRKIQNKNKNQQKSQQQQIIMKQKVQQWKKIKQQKKLQEQELKRQEQQRKKYQNYRRIQQNNLRKQVLQKWKQQQQQIRTKKLRQSRDTKRTTQTIDKQTQQRIRERQQKLIAQKIEKAMKKKYQQQQKLQKQQKLKQKKMVKYSYVNSKLQQKTTAIKQKERQKFDGKNKKDANTFGGNLLHTGVRATPTWMQGL